jgi:hypothetical protein
MLHIFGFCCRVCLKKSTNLNSNTMINYRQLLSICKRMKINPDAVGDNILRDSVPVLYKPFDLTEIKKFPKKEMEQIFLLGQVVYNLNSQLPSNLHYDLTLNEGKLKMEKDLNIRKVISVVDLTLNFLLSFGLLKAKSDKGLIIHNGFVYENDENQIRKMEDMDKCMQDVHVDFKQKEAGSQKSASKVYL